MPFGRENCPLQPAELAPGLQPATVLGEDLDAVVARVRHIEVVLVVEGNRGGPLELAVAVALRAPLHQWHARRREFLDTVVVGIRDVDAAIAAHGEAARSTELTGAGALRAELHQRLPLGRKLLDPMAIRLDDPDRVVRRDGHAVRVAELPRAVPLGAPHGEERTIRRELLDAVVAHVRDVHIAGAIECDPRRVVELAVGIAPAEDLPSRRLPPPAPAARPR